MRLKTIPVCLLALIAACAPLWAVPNEKTRWTRIDTPNFTFFSDAQDWRAEQIAQDLELLRAVLMQTTRGMKFNSPVPTYVYAFRNDRSFRPYKLGEDGQPKSLVGYFVAAADANFVTIDAGPDVDHGVIYHEYLHHYVDHNLPRAPLWLNEGLAEFYSTFDMSGRSRAKLGLPVRAHLDFLKRSKPIPLAKLFEVGHGDPEYNEADRQGTFYAQSWALVHMLLTQHGEAFGGYLKTLGAGGAEDAGLPSALGLSELQLQGELNAYIRRGSFAYFSAAVDAEIVESIEPQAVPMARAETLFRLGDLLVHRDPLQVEAAVEHLETAMREDPALVGAYRARGQLAERRKSWDEALNWLERARGIDPRHAPTLVRLGTVVAERYFASLGPTFEVPQSTPQELLEAREHFRLALELAPENVEALGGLAKSYILDSKGVEEGLAAAIRASTAQPARPDLLQIRTILTANDGRPHDARDLFQRALLPRVDDAEALRSVEMAIVNAVILQALDLSNGGDKDGARALLTAERERLHDPSLEPPLADALAKIDENAIAGARIDRYNVAVRAARAGELESALATLEQLLAEGEQDEVTQPAERLAQRLREAMVRNAQIARFQAAVALANDGKDAEAIAELRSLLEEQLPEDLEETARGVLAGLEGGG